MRRRNIPVCPRCFSAMHRLYMKRQEGGKLFWITVGWFCPSCNVFRDAKGYHLVKKDYETFKEICRDFVKVLAA